MKLCLIAVEGLAKNWDFLAVYVDLVQ